VTVASCIAVIVFSVAVGKVQEAVMMPVGTLTPDSFSAVRRLAGD